MGHLKKKCDGKISPVINVKLVGPFVHTVTYSSHCTQTEKRISPPDPTATITPDEDDYNGRLQWNKRDTIHDSMAILVAVWAEKYFAIISWRQLGTIAHLSEHCSDFAVLDRIAMTRADWQDKLNQSCNILKLFIWSLFSFKTEYKVLFKFHHQVSYHVILILDYGL